MARYIDADGCFEDYILHRALFGNDIYYIDYVKKYPTEDVAPVVRAKWLHNSRANAPRCSACRRTMDSATPYCPFCGAKMDAEEEGGADNGD